MRPYIDTTITLSSRRGKGEVFTKLGRIPGVQMIYVSALACTRHRNVDFISLQRQGRLSFLMFDGIDMITGDYIDKTKQAAAEIAAGRSPTGIVLLTGCQSALLSTDYKLLSEEIEQEIGVPVRVHDGCRLCGFDEEEGGPSAIERILYDFILPAKPAGEISVNLLSNSPLDERNELLRVLNEAGVTTIRTLSDCRSWDEYQAMGTARVNIITSTNDVEIAVYLEEKLGIPWVCMGGIYDADALAAAYEKLGQLLNRSFDLSAPAAKLSDALQHAKAVTADKKIIVEDDGELAKWLLNEGFPVTTVKLNPHQGISKELRAWLSEHGVTVENAVRGPGGKPGGHPGGPGGRPGGPGGKPGGRGGSGGPQPLRIGYAGALWALESLVRSAGGDAR